MDTKDLERFRSTLQNHRDALLEWLDSDLPHKEKHLVGCPDGDVEQLISELKNALGRVESGEFGKCQECDGEVETDRLTADFTECLCLDHYTKDQLRNLESELEQVSQVQKDLLPCKVPRLQGIEMAARTESAGIVGGDYYDFYNCQSGAQGLVIADVMNKGLPASMLMSNLQAALRILGPQVKGIELLAGRLNSFFLHNLNLIRFISLFLAAVDVKSRTLKYSNAGHHPPLWWQAETGSVEWLCPTGPALGLTHDPQYTSESVTFNSGDIFVFYTDGLVEAQNLKGQTFDEKRLAVYVRNHLHQTADDLLNGIFETAKNLAGKFHDDVTLVVLKVQ